MAMAMAKENVSLGVPGLTAIQHKNQTFALKVIWILMFIVCSFVSLRQISERITYFFTYPVMLTFELSDTEPFPYVTFCPRHWPKRNEFTMPFYKTMNNCETAIQTMGRSCLTQDQWTSHNSTTGLAYTINLENKLNVTIGFTRFYIHSIFVKNWRIMLHDNEIDIAYGCITQTQDIERDDEMLISYVRKKMMYENVPTRPCQSNSDYKMCIIACFDNAIARENYKCRMPFMTTMDQLPECTEEEVERTTEWLQVNFEGQNMFGGCNCTKSCVKSTFELDLDSNYYENLTIITVGSGRAETDFLRERRSYTFYALLSEVGGIIGFYLGACVLTCVQLLQRLATRLHGHLNRPTGKPYVSATKPAELLVS